MSKAVFAIANVLFRYFYPVYRFIYFIFKRKQDSYEISILKRFIKPGSTVIDIGANVGFYAELLAELVGETGEVHAFEPDPVNYRHLKSTVRNKKNIFANNMAISNQPGELKLYTSNLLNVDHRSYPVDDFGTSFTVKAETLDNYLKDKGKKVNFIKMDIQGAEFFALTGMKETLESNTVIKMLCEFWPYGLKEAGCTVEIFQKYLQELKFLFYIIQDDKLVRIYDLQEYKDRPKIEYFNLLISKTEI
jgi:FkbM family methyltransferase